MNNSMKHVIVTGASRGLGLALARLLLDRGYAVGSFSRRPSEATEELTHASPRPSSTQREISAIRTRAVKPIHG